MNFWRSEKGLRIATLSVAVLAVGGSLLVSPLIDMMREDGGRAAKGGQEQPKEASDYLEALEALEAQELSGVWEAIRDAEGETAVLAVSGSDAAAGQEEPESDISWAKRFENSVIMGDSIAVGFTEFQYLDATSVVARTGISLPAVAPEVETAAALAPQNIFLFYGFNDIGHDGENYDRFRRNYAALLDQLREQIPEAAIYVNSIFQPLPDNQTMNGYYNDVSPYNQVLEELCEEYGITYLDNTELPSEEDFAKDGYHLNAGFYPRWLKAMAEAAGL